MNRSARDRERLRDRGAVRFLAKTSIDTLGRRDVYCPSRTHKKGFRPSPTGLLLERVRARCRTPFGRPFCYPVEMEEVMLDRN